MTALQLESTHTDQPHADTVELLPVELIDRAEDNPRTPIDLDEFRTQLATYREDPTQTPDTWHPLCELAESIAAQGVLQPVTVTPRDGRYLLVMGERRWAAATAVDAASIRAIVKPQTDAQRREAMVIENLHREDLTPLEEARAFANLKELGYSQRKTAKLSGVSQAHISKRMALLRLPKKVQKLLAERQLTIREAEALAQLAAHRERLHGLLEVILSHKPTGIAEATLTSRLKGELEAIARDKERATRRKAAQQQAEADSLTLLEWPPEQPSWFHDRDERPLVGQEHGRCVHDQAALVEAGTATLAAHAELTCHAATICPHGDLVLLCTTPADHEPEAITPTKPAPAPAAAADATATLLDPPDLSDDGDATADPPVEVEAEPTETDQERVARERAETEARRLREEAEAAARREAKEREEAEAAYQAHQDALAHAATVRQQHIATLVSEQRATKTELVDLITFMTYQWIATYPETYCKDVCDLLGITTTSAHAKRHDHASALTGWIAEDPATRAIQAGKAIALLLAEGQLAGRHARWTAPEVLRHFEYLTAHGYEPTPPRAGRTRRPATSAPRVTQATTSRAPRRRGPAGIGATGASGSSR